MHQTCRSCHVPPPEPEPTSAAEAEILTDCAVCHVPERSPRSLAKLFSDGAVAPRVSFDDSVPESARGPWTGALRERLADSALTALDAPSANAPAVEIRVAVKADEGRTDHGVRFFAARARAVVRLHRAKVKVRGRPGVSKERDEAVRAALEHLVENVYLVLTW